MMFGGFKQPPEVKVKFFRANWRNACCTGSFFGVFFLKIWISPKKRSRGIPLPIIGFKGEVSFVFSEVYGFDTKTVWVSMVQ